ncbi:hypothetical protein [Mesobacillus maritimus]|uniref:hypothetical protein n=1 Tax=Mesobacillus maritimus TaxID=1643336 RepID=UPI003851148A
MMKSLSPTFFIGSIRIGTIQDASCVNFGNNFPTDLTSQKKQNQGFGNISGDHNDIHDILSRLTEKDKTEIFTESPTDSNPEWLEEMIKNQQVDIQQDS